MQHAYLPALPLVAVLLSACATLPDSSSPRQPARTVSVQLLAINDFHGHLEPPSGTNGRINSVDAGGVEYLATHLKNAIAEQPDSIVVGAGDLVGASPITSALFHDEPTIEALNLMGLSVASVGNHEFDEGHEELQRLRTGGCHPTDGCQDGDGFEGARFDYLSANVVRKSTGTPLLPPTVVRTVGTVKVGFIGQTFVGTSQVVPASVPRDLTFVDEARVANAYAEELKRQGVNAIVLLIHQGLRQSGPSLDPNGCDNVSGGLEPILEQLTTDISVVISGHTHAFYNCRINGRLVTSASSYGRMLTRVALEIDAVSGRVVKASATNQPVTRDVAKDPELSKLVAKYRALVDQTAKQVVGSIARDLVRAPNAAGESPLGSVVADAQLAATRSPEHGGAEVAFMNPGGIRSDIVGDADTPVGQPRQVTYGDLYAVQPFGNTVMTLTMTGDMIKRLLEQQFDNPTPGQTEMLQISEGFSYRYRVKAAKGAHVDPDSIQLNGRRIGPTDRVRVAVNDFLLGGGDGFTVFSEGTDRISIVGDISALVDYFKARSPVTPPPQTRIVRVD